MGFLCVWSASWRQEGRGWYNEPALGGTSSGIGLFLREALALIVDIHAHYYPKEYLGYIKKTGAAPQSGCCSGVADDGREDGFAG